MHREGKKIDKVSSSYISGRRGGFSQEPGKELLFGGRAVVAKSQPGRTSPTSPLHLPKAILEEKRLPSFGEMPVTSISPKGTFYSRASKLSSFGDLKVGLSLPARMVKSLKEIDFSLLEWQSNRQALALICLFNEEEFRKLFNNDKDAFIKLVEDIQAECDALPFLKPVCKAMIKCVSEHIAVRSTSEGIEEEEDPTKKIDPNLELITSILKESFKGTEEEDIKITSHYAALVILATNLDSLDMSALNSKYVTAYTRFLVTEFNRKIKPEISKISTIALWIMREWKLSVSK